MLLIYLILLPLLATFVSVLARRDSTWLGPVALVTATTNAIVALFAMHAVATHGSYGYGTILIADSLSTIVLVTVAVVGCAATFYSVGYLREETEKGIIGFTRVRQYYVLLHCFIAAMFFAVVTTSPILMWISIEATTLSTVFLISFYNKHTATEAAWKYFIINSIGLLLGFLGTILFFTSVREISTSELIAWSTLAHNIGLFDPAIAKIAFVFVLVGYGTKAGLVPMHTWLPDAHGKAPSPISALLSGALLNVAFLAILRFKILTDLSVGAEFTRGLLLFFGTISIAIPAFIILVQKNYKRLFAYSSIEHMGIVSLGFGFGGIGSFAALLHMVYHSLTKSILFLSAGSILLKFSSTKLHKVHGLLSVMPVTGVILLLAFLSICGIPPFGTFFTEFYILLAGIDAHPILVVCIIGLLAFIFAGFLRHIASIVYGTPGSDITHGEFRPLLYMPLIIMTIVLVSVSLYIPRDLHTILDMAAANFI